MSKKSIDRLGMLGAGLAIILFIYLGFLLNRQSSNNPHDHRLIFWAIGQLLCYFGVFFAPHEILKYTSSKVDDRVKVKSDPHLKRPQLAR